MTSRLRWLMVLASSLTAFRGAASPLDAAARPNVLIIVTDDQGMGDFSCYGNPVLKTPELDGLFARSVRLADFHVAPMCTPTRGQLMSGLDAVRNGATSVTGGRAFMRPGLPTLPELLGKAGYATGLFGKWHLGDNAPHRPIDRGFQESLYHKGWGFTSAPEFDTPLFDGRCFHNARETTFSGYCTDVWFARAIDWMRQQRERDQPFFCYLPLNAPHAPHDVPDRYAEPYREKGPANYYGMIANIDENIGRLASFLKESPLDENTLLIFMTDNGATAGRKVWNAGLREGKTTFYDGGHRVPCWIRWPDGRIGEPRDVDALAHVQDVLPTVLAATGVEAKGAAFDGISLLPLLRGEASLPDRKLVVQYSRAKLTQWECCVMWNRWRLVKGIELYDVVADRAQTRDVADQHPDVVSAMRSHYEAWWKELEPRSSQWVATAVGSPLQRETELTSSDWQDVYADNAGHVRSAAGGPRGGAWQIDVARAGRYEISLRRWPRERNVPLIAPLGPASKALAIAGAKLSIDGAEPVPATSLGDVAATFHMSLNAGSQSLQAWFVDAEGRDLCGAFYAYITPLK